MKKNILFCSFPDFSGNAKSLYDYMKKKKIKNLVWVVFDEHLVKELKKNNVQCYHIDSPWFKKVFQDSKIIFDTHGRLFEMKKDDQIYVNLWHGTGVKEIGYMLKEEQRAPQDNYYYSVLKNKMDYIIVPSEFWRAIYSAEFFFPFERILSLGLPRVDELFLDKKKMIEKILNIKFDNYSKVGIYLPTFRKGIGRELECEVNSKNSLNLDLYSENELSDYLIKNNILLLIKYHPSEEIVYEKNTCKNVIYIPESLFVENDITLYNLLNITDFMITDYSSVYIEYLVLNKPIIFLHNDIEKYKKKRGLLFNNDDFWFPGRRIGMIGELFDELNNLLCGNDNYANQRNTFKKLMFDSDGRNNCKRIYNYFFDKEGNINKNVSMYYSDGRKYEDTLEGIKNKDEYINLLKHDYDELRKELIGIINSKSYKIINSIKKIIFFYRR